MRGVPINNKENHFQEQEHCTKNWSLINNKLNKKNTDIEENNITRPITNFDYEHNLENKKRELFILRPEYISVVLDDINDISSYKKGSTEYVDETLKKAENIRLY